MTKKKNHGETVQADFLRLRDGIPQKQEAIKIHDLSLKDCGKRNQ